MFYTFSQNNSGGYFVKDHDAGVAEYIIIEANNADDARSRFWDIGEFVDGFRSYCRCCGDRWSDDMIDDDDGTERPEIYGQHVRDFGPTIFREECFLHTIDGKMELIKLKERA